MQLHTCYKRPDVSDLSDVSDGSDVFGVLGVPTQHDIYTILPEAFPDTRRKGIGKIGKDLPWSLKIAAS